MFLNKLIIVIDIHDNCQSTIKCWHEQIVIIFLIKIKPIAQSQKILPGAEINMSLMILNGKFSFYVSWLYMCMYVCRHTLESFPA